MVRAGRRVGLAPVPEDPVYLDRQEIDPLALQIAPEDFHGPDGVRPYLHLLTAARLHLPAFIDTVRQFGAVLEYPHLPQHPRQLIVRESSEFAHIMERTRPLPFERPPDVRHADLRPLVEPDRIAVIVSMVIEQGDFLHQHADQAHGAPLCPADHIEELAVVTAQEQLTRSPQRSQADGHEGEVAITAEDEPEVTLIEPREIGSIGQRATGIYRPLQSRNEGAVATKHLALVGNLPWRVPPEAKVEAVDDEDEVGHFGRGGLRKMQPPVPLRGGEIGEWQCARAFAHPSGNVTDHLPVQAHMLTGDHNRGSALQDPQAGSLLIHIHLAAFTLTSFSHTGHHDTTSHGGKIMRGEVIAMASLFSKDHLAQTLRRIDGRGYPAYRECEGSYDFGTFELHIDHTQADPFAPPSAIRVSMAAAAIGIPPNAFANRSRRTGAEDYLLRRFAAAVEGLGRRRRGSGKSGLITIYRPGQEMLERSALVLRDGRVEVRFGIGLPAAGRTVLGRQAYELFFSDLPEVVGALRLDRAAAEACQAWCDCAEDQDWLRAKLPELGLVAFVASGAILPRASGASDLPLSRDKARPFRPPRERTVLVHLPHRGVIEGMGVPVGVTLITGGGYHGKSTLLRTIERGVYNHIPGDGRELCVTVPGAVKIRAEDGRSVQMVDISPFITNLPDGQDTTRFSTPNASGSTSQAANIMESLEMGATCLLLDEDTSATNFMIRDRRMQALIARDREPITPFIDRVRELYEEMGVSTVLVVGGAGDYLDVADTVILMDAYEPRDVTGRAREIARAYPSGRAKENTRRFTPPKPRIPLPEGFDARRGAKEKIKTRGFDEILFGREEIDLRAVEQVVEEGQTRAIAAILRHAANNYMDGKRTLRQALEAALAEIDERGLDLLAPFPGRPAGDLARPRLHELACAANRLRSLRIK